MIPLLERLFVSQAYRELGAARLFESGLVWAPDPGAQAELLEHAREEREHYGAVMDIWSGLTGTPPRTLEPLVEERLRARPLPQAASWLDLAMARFLFDRAGLWQMREYQSCAYKPYRALARRIVDEERNHQRAGAAMVVELCQAGSEREQSQAVFTRWLRPALLSFGRSGTVNSSRAVALGLKRRDPSAVLQDFVDDIRPVMQASALSFPPADQLKLEFPATLRW